MPVTTTLAGTIPLVVVGIEPMAINISAGAVWVGRVVVGALIAFVLLLLMPESWPKKKVLSCVFATVAVLIGLFADFPKDRKRPAFRRLVLAALGLHLLVLGLAAYLSPRWHIQWPMIAAFFEGVYFRGFLIRRGFTPRL